MELSLLTPQAALIGLVVLIPLAAIWLRERRAGRVRRLIGLEPPLRRSHVPAVVALLVAFALLAAAAAQPMLRGNRTVTVRTDAEVFVTLDTTGSMAAGSARGAPTRFERAVDFALQLRAALPELQVGVASLTNRPLPHLFPTADAGAFVATAVGAVGVNRPPPGPDMFLRATSFESLEAFANENFFSPDSVQRLVVLLSDGESQGFAPKILAGKLSEGGVQLIVVRFWDATERIWLEDGDVDRNYAPLASAHEFVSDLAALTIGRRIYEETELGEVVAIARGYLGDGPVGALETTGPTGPLGLYLVLAATLPLALLLARGLSWSPVGRRRTVLHTVWSSAWPGSSRAVARRSSRAPAPPRPS